MNDFDVGANAIHRLVLMLAFARLLLSPLACHHAHPDDSSPHIHIDHLFELCGHSDDAPHDGDPDHDADAVYLSDDPSLVAKPSPVIVDSWVFANIERTTEAPLSLGSGNSVPRPPGRCGGAEDSTLLITRRLQI